VAGHWNGRGQGLEYKTIENVVSVWDASSETDDSPGRSCGRERSSAPPTPTSQPVLFLPSSRGYRCLPEGIPAGILQQCSALWQIHLELSRTHRVSRHRRERFSAVSSIKDRFSRFANYRDLPFLCWRSLSRRLLSLDRSCSSSINDDASMMFNRFEQSRDESVEYQDTLRCNRSRKKSKRSALERRTSTPTPLRSGTCSSAFTF